MLKSTHTINISFILLHTAREADTTYNLSSFKLRYLLTFDDIFV